MSLPNVAPLGACVVCGKKHPGGENAPDWTYLAGSKPMGAIACSQACLKVALDRARRGERVDGQKPPHLAADGYACIARGDIDKEGVELTDRIAPYLFHAWTEARSVRPEEKDLVACVEDAGDEVKVMIGTRQEFVANARKENMMAAIGPIAHANAYDATPQEHRAPDPRDMLWVLVWKKGQGTAPKVVCTIRWRFDLSQAPRGSA